MIETFEELYEEVKKLYPNCKKIDKITKGLHLTDLNIKFDTLKITICIDRECDNYILIFNKQGMRPTKDPQKIYNVIKAIKECEDE